MRGENHPELVLKNKKYDLAQHWGMIYSEKAGSQKEKQQGQRLRASL